MPRIVLNTYPSIAPPAGPSLAPSDLAEAAIALRPLLELHSQLAALATPDVFAARRAAIDQTHADKKAALRTELRALADTRDRLDRRLGSFVGTDVAALRAACREHKKMAEKCDTRSAAVQRLNDEITTLSGEIDECNARYRAAREAAPRLVSQTSTDPNAQARERARQIYRTARRISPKIVRDLGAGALGRLPLPPAVRERLGIALSAPEVAAQLARELSRLSVRCALNPAGSADAFAACTRSMTAHLLGGHPSAPAQPSWPAQAAKVVMAFSLIAFSMSLFKRAIAASRARHFVFNHQSMLATIDPAFDLIDQISAIISSEIPTDLHRTFPISRWIELNREGHTLMHAIRARLHDSLNFAQYGAEMDAWLKWARDGLLALPRFYESTRGAAPESDPAMRMIHQLQAELNERLQTHTPLIASLPRAELVPPQSGMAVGLGLIAMACLWKIALPIRAQIEAARVTNQTREAAPQLAAAMLNAHTSPTQGEDAAPDVPPLLHPAVSLAQRDDADLDKIYSALRAVSTKPERAPTRAPAIDHSPLQGRLDALEKNLAAKRASLSRAQAELNNIRADLGALDQKMKSFTYTHPEQYLVIGERIAVHSQIEEKNREARTLDQHLRRERDHIAHESAQMESQREELGAKLDEFREAPGVLDAVRSATKLATRRAIELAYERHVGLSIDALESRLRCGRFTHINGESISTANVELASSYLSDSHLHFALLDAASKAPHTPNDAEYFIDHPFPIGVSVRIDDRGEAVSAPAQRSVVRFIRDSAGQMRIAHIYPAR